MAEKRIECPVCWGRGIKGAGKCARCEGTGRITVGAKPTKSNPQLSHTGRSAPADHYERVERAMRTNTGVGAYLAVREEVVRVSKTLPSYWRMAPEKREAMLDFETRGEFEVRRMKVPRLASSDNGHRPLDEDEIRGMLAGPAV